LDRCYKRFKLPTASPTTSLIDTESQYHLPSDVSLSLSSSAVGLKLQHSFTSRMLRPRERHQTSSSQHIGNVLTCQTRQIMCFVPELYCVQGLSGTSFHCFQISWDLSVCICMCIC
jgi:hypothetical protein